MLKVIKNPARLLGLLMVVIAATFNAMAQSTVSGVVKDASGEPLIGATVLVKGTQTATSTNLDGEFTLQAEPGATIVVSYIGYTTAETPARNGMEVTLTEDNNLLDEVVVIGYGSVKRKDVTTAISTVSSKDLENRPLVSAAQALQGKAAGVSVVSPNGAPGGEMTIRVRGTTSFNGSNDPLYVVDGVPVDNINFLSPSDIADLQILKDASSAAIYGSRAANGVILISTKSASTERPSVTLTAQYGWSKVRKSMDVLNAAQYKELQDEIGMISLPDNLRDRTDWFDEVYRTGSNQNYQVSISQNTGKTKYLMNLGYLREDGVIKPSFYNRYNFRVNVDTEVFSWLNATANVMYSDYTSNGINTGNGANRGGVVLAVINTPTYAPVMDPDNPERFYNNFYGVNITSPLENLARGEYARNRENRLIASGNLLFKIIPGLTFNSKFTLDRRNGHNTDFVDPVTTSYGRENFGIGSDTRSTNQLLVWDNVANYVHDFGRHHLDIMAGQSWTDSKWTQSYIQGTNYRNGSIQTLNAANKINWSSTGTNASDWAIMSWFGRVAYNFDDRYLVTANIRADGSSKLHPDHRWGVFPSFSAAWRMSQERFMRDIQWIDDLKIRGGWGQTGNQSGIGDYAYLQRYNIHRIEWFVEGQANALPTISQGNLRTTDLTWETTTQTNIGVDFSVLRSRINFTADIYWKKTTNMLMNVSLPEGAAAASTIARNEGEMTNRGFEFAITSHNFVGAFQWDTNFNMSFNKNKLTKLSLQKIYTDGRTSDYVNEQVVRNEPGRSLGGFYGYFADGVDPETGELNYRDLNNDGKITSSDRGYIGDPNPDFTFGMTNTFSYKGFHLSIFIQGSYGNDIYNASKMEMMGMYDGKNQITDVLRRWRIPGQITDVPKAGFDMKNSTYFIEDGSYLRVKDITLSYDFSGKWMRKIHLAKLQPYFTVTNLLTWTKYSGMDPEVNQWGNSGAVQGIDWGTYPQTKTFTLGVNVVF
ncbi:MAG: TonB-dependent receptor [Muribaculaceae bacterium]|nr:TonB-dependent receptor [Muribaculaceae bacterium]